MQLLLMDINTGFKSTANPQDKATDSALLSGYAGYIKNTWLLLWLRGACQWFFRQPGNVTYLSWPYLNLRNVLGVINWQK